MSSPLKLSPVKVHVKSAPAAKPSPKASGIQNGTSTVEETVGPEVGLAGVPLFNPEQGTEYQKNISESKSKGFNPFKLGLAYRVSTEIEGLIKDKITEKKADEIFNHPLIKKLLQWSHTSRLTVEDVASITTDQLNVLNNHDVLKYIMACGQDTVHTILCTPFLKAGMENLPNLLNNLNSTRHLYNRNIDLISALTLTPVQIDAIQNPEIDAYIGDSPKKFKEVLHSIQPPNKELKEVTQVQNFLALQQKIKDQTQPKA